MTAPISLPDLSGEEPIDICWDLQDHDGKEELVLLHGGRELKSAVRRLDHLPSDERRRGPPGPNR